MMIFKNDRTPTIVKITYNEIHVGTLFTCSNLNQGKGLYLKCWGCIIDLKNPSYVWFSSNNIIDIVDFKELDAEVIIKEKN